MQNRKTKPISIIVMSFLLILSIGFPPLLVIVLPFAAWQAWKLYRQVQYVRRSRDFWIEEQRLLRGSRMWDQ